MGTNLLLKNAMARVKEKNAVMRFDKISIGLASPESILAVSRGEVSKPETINYRTHFWSCKGLRVCLWEV